MTTITKQTNKSKCKLTTVGDGEMLRLCIRAEGISATPFMVQSASSACTGDLEKKTFIYLLMKGSIILVVFASTEYHSQQTLLTGLYSANLHTTK